MNTDTHNIGNISQITYHSYASKTDLNIQYNRHIINPGINHSIRKSSIRKQKSKDKNKDKLKR